MLAPLWGKSSARVTPGRGNDIMPGDGLSPKVLSTARNDPSPEALTVEDLRDRLARGGVGHDELVLQEAALAVHAVPVLDRVQGIEEGVDRARVLRTFFTGCL